MWADVLVESVRSIFQDSPLRGDPKIGFESNLKELLGPITDV